MPWLWGAAALIAAGWLWVWWASGTVANEVPDAHAFARMLRLLISRGVHKDGVKATLTICERTAKERRLVFTKHIASPSDVGLTATIPRERWLEPVYAALLRELDRCGVRYEDVAARRGRALQVRLGKDIGAAYMVARALFAGAMGFDLHRDCVACFRDVVIPNAPHLTGVDDPDTDWT